MEEELKKQVKEQVEEKISNIMEQGIQSGNIENLGMLIDIHKDIANEEYWCKKEENMRYREYGNYPMEYGRRGRDGRGRYAGRRGGMYHGDDMIEEMREHYGTYMDSREEMDRGNYGAEGGVIKSLEYMLQAAVDFVEKLKEDAGSEEEMQLIRKYTRKMSEM